jgi:hypothetical protein
MPLIQREKKEMFRTIPIKLEEGLAERFLAYAEFLESSKDRKAGRLLPADVALETLREKHGLPR